MKVSLVEWNNERGSALLLMIIVAMILLFLGGSLGVLAAVESRMAQREEVAMQACYLARSGVDAVAQGIIDNAESINDLIDEAGGKIQFEPVPFENGGTSSIEVFRYGDCLTVRSTGTIKGSNYTVELIMNKSVPDFDFKEAVFASSEGSSGKPAIELIGGASVEGNVATNTVGKNSVKFSGGTKINGNLQVGPGANPKEVVQVNDNGQGVVGEVVNLPGRVVFPEVVFPEFPTNLLPRGEFNTPTQKDYLIEEDGWYDIIHTFSNRKLQIDLKNGTRTIRVAKLVVGGPIQLLNPEGGQLILYVAQEISRDGGDAHINYPDNGPYNPSARTLYYAGQGEFWNEQFKMQTLSLKMRQSF